MLTAFKIGSRLGCSITHWFQPIYCLKHSNVVAYEALLRDASSLQIAPMDIFKEAEKHSCLNILDLISVKAAAEKFNDNSAYLFLNIFPSTLLKKDFLSWWDANIPPLKPIVLELLENEPVGNWEELKAVTKEL
ncbi:MAG: EAL domain-containing protein, partial [Clostridiaceae bacterium]|nr:EAL domain-containing protein [Clostridiaceae bacterium]